MSFRCNYRRASRSLERDYGLVASLPFPNAWKRPLRTWIARRIKSERAWDSAFLSIMKPDGTIGQLDGSKLTVGRIQDGSIT